MYVPRMCLVDERENERELLRFGFVFAFDPEKVGLVFILFEWTKYVEINSEIIASVTIYSESIICCIQYTRKNGSKSS